MATTNHIVKRHGHTEGYDSRKLYASIYASCLSVRATQGEAELAAGQVVKEVEAWLKTKHEVTAHDIRRQGAVALNVINPDAAYIYNNHKQLHR
jgi:transcriptional regulator NrdR family protein